MGQSVPLTDRNGQPLDLVLYKFDACPYCQRVMRRADALGIPLRLRDTLHEAGARAELIDRGGKGQVPCLMVNGAPLYESADIIAYLETEVVRATPRAGG